MGHLNAGRCRQVVAIWRWLWAQVWLYESQLRLYWVKFVWFSQHLSIVLTNLFLYYWRVKHILPLVLKFNSTTQFCTLMPATLSGKLINFIKKTFFCIFIRSIAAVPNLYFCSRTQKQTNSRNHYEYLNCFFPLIWISHTTKNVWRYPLHFSRATGWEPLFHSIQL